MDIFGSWDDDLDDLGNHPLSPRVLSQEMLQLKGRELTTNDIGKKIFRIAPFINITRDKWIPDKSFFPQNIKELNSNSEELLGLEAKDGKIKLKFNWESPLLQYYDDGNWITVEEAMKTLSLKG